ncbi:MAG: Hsp33 family molecular chaperone HslO [Myxococcaceae bacterium]
MHVPDELLTALLPGVSLRVVVATTTGLCREARARHRAGSASASVLAAGLTGVSLLAGLQKEETRVSLQLECDGALRGFYTDATTSGAVRGYVKNALLQHLGEPGPYRFRPALGNKGFLSTVRELGAGEFYRSSVDLQAFELASDLERYFQASEQVDSVVALEVLAEGDEALFRVAGLLVQCLPGGDGTALEAYRRRLHGQGALAHALLGTSPSAAGLLRALFAEAAPEVLSVRPLGFQCRCSRERVKQALRLLGRGELEELLREDGKADVTCEFCTTAYVIDAEEIRSLLEA